MKELGGQRQRMLERHLRGRGIRDARVLAAMAAVPRELFVPEHLRAHAYDDSPLPIGGGQTISQPYIVALMAEALELRPEDRVLEIGTGSGYGAAVLAEIAEQVWTMERDPELAEAARRRLRRAGYGGIEVVVGDGSRGWPAAAPYDAIVVTAGAPEVPPSLKAQLAPGGRLVIPIGSSPRLQRLVRVRGGEPDDQPVEHLADVRFVPLVGEEGWDEDGGS